MERNWIGRKWIVLTAAVFLGAGCVLESDKEAGRGTVVDNELRVGFVYLADGTPAKGAKVRLFPVDHLPDSGAPAFSDYADDKGKYKVDSLPRGEYNVLSELKGQYSFADSIFISDSTKVISQDTLGAPGSVAGIVGLQPNHDPITVTVQVMGTNAFVNVEGDGHFRVGNLARGTYTLRLLATLPEYTPLYKTITIQGGKNDSLKDTLWLPFTGIPVVRNISAAYDTLNGVMHLSWSPASYRNFSEYLVYRDVANAGVLSYVPIGVTTDTTYRDSLVGNSQGFPNPQSGSFGARYRYRVRIRSRSDEIGLAYDFAEVDAPSPATVSTVIEATVTSVKWDAEKQVDSRRCGCTREQSGKGTCGSELGPGPSGFLRLHGTFSRHACGRVPPEIRLATARCLRHLYQGQGRGRHGASENRLDDSQSAPQISLSWPDSIWANAPLTLQPQVYDPDWDKLKFTSSSLPKWLTLDSLTGELKGTPTNQDTGLVSGLSISVKDGRRTVQSAPAALYIKRSAWSLKANMPFAGSMYDNLLAVNLGDSIMLIHYWNDHIRHAYFYPATGTWSKPVVNDLPGVWDKDLYFGQSVNGQVFAFGHNYYTNRTQAFIFDLATSNWRTGASCEQEFRSLSGDYIGNKFLMAGAARGDGTRILLEYDPTTDAWSVMKDSDWITRPICFWSQGKLYSVFGVEAGPISLDAYDPVGKTWAKNLSWPEPVGRRLFSLGLVNGKVYALGGYTEWSTGGTIAKSKTRTDAYDLAMGTSKRVSDRILSYSLSACTESGGKFFCFGGRTSAYNLFDEGSLSNQSGVEEYDPSLEF